MVVILGEAFMLLEFRFWIVLWERQVWVEGWCSSSLQSYPLLYFSKPSLQLETLQWLNPSPFASSSLPSFFACVFSSSFLLCPLPLSLSLSSSQSSVCVSFICNLFRVSLSISSISFPYSIPHFMQNTCQILRRRSWIPGESLVYIFSVSVCVSLADQKERMHLWSSTRKKKSIGCLEGSWRFWQRKEMERDFCRIMERMKLF